jgi:hypothetical protein
MSERGSFGPISSRIIRDAGPAVVQRGRSGDGKHMARSPLTRHDMLRDRRALSRKGRGRIGAWATRGTSGIYCSRNLHATIPSVRRAIRAAPIHGWRGHPGSRDAFRQGSPASIVRLGPCPQP